MGGSSKLTVRIHNYQKPAFPVLSKVYRLLLLNYQPCHRACRQYSNLLEVGN